MVQWRRRIPVYDCNPLPAPCHPVSAIYVLMLPSSLFLSPLRLQMMQTGYSCHSQGVYVGCVCSFPIAEAETKACSKENVKSSVTDPPTHCRMQFDWKPSWIVHSNRHSLPATLEW